MVIGAIEKELRHATGLKPNRREPRQDFLFRIAISVNKFSDWGWSMLSFDAQNWQNEAMVSLYDDDSKSRLSKEDRKILRTLLEKYGSGVVRTCITLMKFKEPPLPKITDFPKDPKPNNRSKKWSAIQGQETVTKHSRSEKRKSKRLSRNLTRR